MTIKLHLFNIDKSRIDKRTQLYSMTIERHLRIFEWKNHARESALQVSSSTSPAIQSLLTSNWLLHIAGLPTVFITHQSLENMANLWDGAQTPRQDTSWIVVCSPSASWSASESNKNSNRTKSLYSDGSVWTFLEQKKKYDRWSILQFNVCCFRIATQEHFKNVRAGFRLYTAFEPRWQYVSIFAFGSDRQRILPSQTHKEGLHDILDAPHSWNTTWWK